MSSNKLEYDSTLGGPIVLENHVQTYRYAAAGVAEMRQLLDEIRNPTSTKLAFQTLPKQMRRRAMSHHPKRLPRKYRAIHCSQMAKAGKPQQTRRPSRKYRRKPSNLLKEYIRRQRKQRWLETHIWHAKRFHMVTRWGYRLPYASCDKTYRACYRASAEHCLLQDISHWACVQLVGAQETIIAGLAQLSSKRCGQTVAARSYLEGAREGTVQLFRAGQYPAGALGVARFLWRPFEVDGGEEVIQTKEPTSEARRTLWLWLHPSGYDAVFEQLLNVFSLKAQKSVTVPVQPEDAQRYEEDAQRFEEKLEEQDKLRKGEELKKKEAELKSKKKQTQTGNEVDEETESKMETNLKEKTVLNEDDTELKQKTELLHKNSQPKKKVIKPPKQQERRLQFLTRTSAYERIKRYANDDTAVELSELKDTLNRFRLTGALAHSVLAHAFKAKPLDELKDNAAEQNWFQQQLKSTPDFRAQHETQADYWETCANVNSPGVFLSDMVLALNIVDPRLLRPQRRTKAEPINDAPPSERLQQLLFEPPTTLAQSVIWRQELREQLRVQMLSAQQYCERRARAAIVPGAPCDFERQMQPLPVLLVQRPGSQLPQYKRLGYGCGWDVIAPAGYAMSIWLALIMWGARPGGLREFASIARESGSEEFLPDTLAGQQQCGETQALLRARYFRLPPNKRCNYRKFSTVSPFRVPFAELVRDWQEVPKSSNGANSTKARKSNIETAAIEDGKTLNVSTIKTASLNSNSSSSSDSTDATSPSAESTSNSCSFHILRDRLLLHQLQSCIAHKRPDLLPADISPHSLIQLQFLMKSRGNPGDFALVCLPTRADLKRNLKLIKRENHEPVYTEPLQPDPHEKQRKLLRTEHKKLLKRLRGRRVRVKRKQQQIATRKVHILPAGTAQICAAQFKRMSALWLPELEVKKPLAVRKQCTREVFGYLAQSHYSYIEAKVCAVGYVTVEGLRKLLQLCRSAQLKQPMCLVRGTNSRHYRFASFKLNLQV